MGSLLVDIGLVGLLARLYRDLKPVLRRRERTLVLVGVRTRRIVRLVEIEDPRPVPGAVGAGFEVDVPAGAVRFLAARLVANGTHSRSSSWSLL